MDSAPETKPEKSYLSAAVESISPWATSRTSSPKPPLSAGLPGEGSGLKNQHAGDLVSNHWYGLSQRRYPSDCPPLNARWFYAIDIPKRKPKLLKTEDSKPAKPPPAPKKFVTFSADDSQAIEAAYQRLADLYDHDSRDASQKVGEGFGGKRPSGASKVGNTSIEEAGQNENAGGSVRVPVQEDYLFDVDLERRELCPVYWLGPIYEVRRGSWFYQEGSTLRPCEENLALQLEEGYLKIKPWRYPKAPEKSISRPSSIKPGDSLALSGAFGGRNRVPSSTGVTPKASMENLRATNQQALSDASHGSKDAPSPSPHQPETYRLFGTYMNSIVTYQDSAVAWLSEDSIMSRVSSNIYQKFAGGGYLGGVKIVRGYSEASKGKDSAVVEDRPRTPNSASATSGNTNSLQVDERQQRLLKRRSAPPTAASRERAVPREDQFSSLTSDGDPDDEEEVARKRDEKEIRDDYHDFGGEQSREVEHLILVTHGIGQRLGLRTDSVNFVHDVNVLRQTLKGVYSNSVDMQALNSEIDKLPKNCRVQVLPVCWRHLLDFPRKGVRQTRKEHDLGDAFADEEEYPSLEDITVDGVPFVRSLITDLALDILLYQSAYREHIATIVLEESNRIYKLFCERNPNFVSKGGKVSLIGHSLGSAIYMDLLCRQREDMKNPNKRRAKPHHGKDLSFDFDVPSFFCLGSPIGLFQMLKGRTIAARHEAGSHKVESPMNSDYMDDPFLASTSASENFSAPTGLPFTTSSPKCSQLYNIFYPSDPISYRLEPLVSSVYGSMKPQPLPYTKSNFGTAASQGLTGIGAKVGQSVSGLWSSLSSGIASSLLNRSLGLTPADIASMGGPSPSAQTQPVQSSQPAQSIGAGTNISAGGVISDLPALVRENTNEKKRQLAEDTAAADRDGKDSAPTLIDNEIETLYAGFQKGQKNQHDDGGDNDWAAAEERGKKLRREEMKVRALNHTGRIDFQIQESVLDFNPMSTITSHLSYWADEDVAHFILSQLLSRHRNPRTQKDLRR